MCAGARELLLIRHLQGRPGLPPHPTPHPRRSAGGTMDSAARGTVSPDLRVPGLGARWPARLGGSSGLCIRRRRRAGLDPSPLVASDAPVRIGNGCFRLVAAGACAGGDALVGGGARYSCAAAACSRRVDALFCGVPRCNARTRAVLQQQQSNLVAVSVILVIDG